MDEVNQAVPGQVILDWVRAQHGDDSYAALRDVVDPHAYYNAQTAIDRFGDGLTEHAIAADQVEIGDLEDLTGVPARPNDGQVHLQELLQAILGDGEGRRETALHDGFLALFEATKLEPPFAEPVPPFEPIEILSQTSPLRYDHQGHWGMVNTPTSRDATRFATEVAAAFPFISSRALEYILEQVFDNVANYGVSGRYAEGDLRVGLRGPDVVVQVTNPMNRGTIPDSFDGKLIVPADGRISMPTEERSAESGGGARNSVDDRSSTSHIRETRGHRSGAAPWLSGSRRASAR